MPSGPRGGGRICRGGSATSPDVAHQPRTKGRPWSSPRLTAAKATRCHCMVYAICHTTTITVRVARVAIALSCLPVLPPCLRRPAVGAPPQQHTDMIMTTRILASRSLCARQENITRVVPTASAPLRLTQRTAIKRRASNKLDINPVF